MSMSIGVSSGVFSDDKFILSVVFGDQCEYVGVNAFANCSNLKEINENNVIKNIYSNAFANCSNLTNISFPELSTISECAFANCINLEEINLPNVSSIGSSAFTSCSILKSVNLSSESITINEHAFENCNSLQNIYLDNCTSIASSAFYNCISLSNINFKKCKTIGKNAFENCSGLNAISFYSWTNIGSSAFKNCSNLTNIYINDIYDKDTEDSSCKLNNFAFCDCSIGSSQCPNKNITFYIKPETIELYKSYSYWKHYSNNFITQPRDNQIVYTFDGVGNGEDDTLLFHPTFGTKYTVDNIAKNNKNVILTLIKNTTDSDSDNVTEGVFDLDCEIFYGDDRKKLTSIIIPPKCEIIGEKAFESCENLISFTPSETLEYIKKYAFENCVSLTTFTIPESLIDLEEGVFRGCTNIEKFEGNQNFIRYNGRALVNYNKLICVLPKDNSDIEGRIYNISDIDKNITRLGESCFHGCKNIRRINISSDIKEIGDFAFEGCENLYEVHFEGDVPEEMTIGSEIFRGIQTDFKIFVPENKFGKYNRILNEYSKYIYPKPIDDSIIYYADNILNQTQHTQIDANGQNWNLPYYKIPNVTSIPNCFSSTNVKKIILNETITEITKDAFSECTELDYIYLSDNITAFGDKCFYNCNSIKKIHIPDNLTGYGSQTFNGCHNLNEFVSYNKKYVSDDNRCYIKNSTLYFFAEGDIKENSQYIIPNTVKIINACAFINCTKLYEINLPITLTTIGDYAFAGCSNMYLTNNTIHNNITKIGKYAFKDCINIKRVSIPNNTSFYFISTGTFKGCKNMFLEDNIIPKNIISIQNEAFDGCTNLKLDENINIKNVKIIGKYAFRGCENLTTININDTITKINESVFEGCKNLKNLTLPNTLTTIYDKAFYGCSNITNTITIPTNLESIGESAFDGCTNLKLDGDNNTINVTSIGASAFRGCENLTTININSITTINDSVFDGCTNLETVVKLNVQTTPALEKIGNYAFRNCKSLTYLYSSYVTSIGESAFEGCNMFKGNIKNKNEEYSLKINKSLNTMGENCFKNTSIEKLELNTTILETIPTSAFEGCSKLTTVTITTDSKLTTIGENAFKDCTTLSNFNSENSGELILPNSVKYIKDYAFKNCKNLFIKITLNENLLSLGNECFNMGKPINRVNVLTKTPPNFTSNDSNITDPKPFSLNDSSIIVVANQQIEDKYAINSYWIIYKDYLRNYAKDEIE